MNTRGLLIPAILALVVTVGVVADHIPATPSGVVEFEGRTSLLLDFGRFDPLVELEGRLEDANTEFRYRSLTAGAYLRLHKNLKAGAFYRIQQGARHDDDWIEPTLDIWEWVDSRSRTEQVLILDASPRFQLEFLPGRNWVFAVKNRYQYNTYNDQHSLMVRPGLTYFLLRNRDPLFNFSFNYGLYIPLNFGETLFYEHEPYLSVLYHLNRNVKLELTGAYKTVIWSSSADSPPDTYAVSYRAFVVGFGVLFPVSF
ncbi:MAG: hypothetical protein JSV89_04925 [Spirochaetaceae bacterium]|nr:MAG: hypothetical protein JSV89_04925 [Spirochaetaceae bacterium]